MSTDDETTEASNRPRARLSPRRRSFQACAAADRNFIPVPTLVDANTLVPEAPEDGVIYGRRGSDQTWRPLTVTVNETLEGDGDGLTAPLGVALGHRRSRPAFSPFRTARR